MVVFVADDSGSVVGGNDCVGRRYDEAHAVVAHMHRYCNCRRELAAVLHFDRATGFDAGPTRLDRKGVLRLGRGLQVPRGGIGSSELGPSLADAERIAEAYPTHHVVLCVLSDFELFDSDVDAVLKRLCDFPGTVHAIVLQSEPPPLLLRSGVQVTRIHWGSERGDAARAALGAFTAARGSTP